MSLSDEQAGSPQSSAEDEGLSLDRLSEAFAAMLTGGDDPYSPLVSEDSDPILEVANQSASSERASDASAQQARAARTALDDCCELGPRSILEAILFVGAADNQPLTSQQIAGQLRGVRTAEIDDLIRDLNADYATRHCPYSITAVGAGYRMTLLEQFVPLREKILGRVRPARLSPAAIEVLAAVAYNEPMTADQVTQMRGTASGPILAQLVRRQLLRIDRPAEAPRTAHYFTTPRFLSLFGLESLSDLPRSQELER